MSRLEAVLDALAEELADRAFKLLCERLEELPLPPGHGAAPSAAAPASVPAPPPHMSTARERYLREIGDKICSLLRNTGPRRLSEIMRHVGVDLGPLKEALLLLRAERRVVMMGDRATARYEFVEAVASPPSTAPESSRSLPTVPPPNGASSSPSGCSTPTTD